MATKVKLNDDQKDAFKALQRFIDHPAADTFVLKGYAGTGKTFLMQHLARWLDEKNYKFSLLASTGRAATVLRGKTGQITRTVHSQLYHFSEVGGTEEDFPEDAPIDQHGQLTLLFVLRPPESGERIYIIDESSMLSNLLSEDSSAMSFGSGQLLSDLFTYIGTNKVIFVGDPGQLPPVKEIFSPALDMDWLYQQKRTAISVTLSKIERVVADNDILVLASMIRHMAERELPRFPKLPASNLNNVDIEPTDQLLFQHYLESFKTFGPNKTIAIARSNRMVSDINRALRRELFDGLDKPIQESEVLLVTSNNPTAQLTNGDFVIVSKIGEAHIHVQLHFQSIHIKSLLTDIEHEILISLDVLYGEELNFSKSQLKSIMIDFNRKMKKMGIGPNTEDYKDKMREDPYLNCLRAKYGYAVTCHKAQGGEWNHVYLFLEKSMYSMSHPELLKWWYTAITRAKERLHLARNWWVG